MSLPRGRFLRMAIAVVFCLAVAAPAAASVPIPGPLDGPLPRFTGEPAAPQPLDGPFPPQNPALAPDGRSGTGLVAGNGASSPLPGPLGRLPARDSALLFGSCSGLAFDAQGRLLAACQSPLGPLLHLVHPRTLAVLDTLVVGPRPRLDRNELAGGTHFLVRADGTLLVPAADGTLRRIAVRGSQLVETGRIDLRPQLLAGELPFAVAAGFDGTDWVVGRAGTVVSVPRDGSPPAALRLGEPVQEDLAADPGGVYVVSERALYRIGPGASIAWRTPLRRGPDPAPPGRRHPGPGTPPAVLGSGVVAVADGAGQLVVVEPGTGEPICDVPLFGAIEAHLVAAGDAVVASNASGDSSPLATEGGQTTAGGLARVDVAPGGCKVAWRSDEVAPSSQAAVSRATGLLYAAVKPAGFPDEWALAAIDWRTGATRWRALLGEGLGFNSDGGPVVLGPDATAYAGSMGGVALVRDGVPAP